MIEGLKIEAENEPPEHLSPSTADWWREITEDYLLEPHHLKLFCLACEALDRYEEARAVIAEHGITYQDRFDQPKARPEVAVERDSRIAVSRLLRELQLDVEPPAGSRPPGIGGR